MLGEKHGMSHTPEHNTWLGIKTRCYNPKEAAYPWYGGKGIKMCDRWKESFLTFYQDMGPRPSKKYSIDRIDTNKDYEPDNCRWATREEQANNKGSNVMVTYQGKTQSLGLWAKETGINYYALYFRIVRDKIPVEEAFTRRYGSKPICAEKQRKLSIEAVKEVYTTSIPSDEMAAKYGVDVSTIVSIRGRKTYRNITERMTKGEKPKRRKLGGKHYK